MTDIMALDRLRFHNIPVSDTDTPSQVATELAEVIDEGIEDARGDLATRQDLEILRLDLMHTIKDEISRLPRWSMVTGISLGGAIIALLIALIVRGG